MCLLTAPHALFMQVHELGVLNAQVRQMVLQDRNRCGLLPHATACLPLQRAPQRAALPATSVPMLRSPQVRQADGGPGAPGARSGVHAGAGVHAVHARELIRCALDPHSDAGWTAGAG